VQFPAGTVTVSPSLATLIAFWTAAAAHDAAVVSAARAVVAKQSKKAAHQSNSVRFILPPFAAMKDASKHASI
jgi:hypothetical protein